MPRKPTGEPPGQKGYFTKEQKEWLLDVGKDFKVGTTKEARETNSNFYYETAKAFVRQYDTYASGHPEKEEAAKLDRAPTQLAPNVQTPVISEDMRNTAQAARSFLLENLTKVSPTSLATSFHEVIYTFQRVGELMRKKFQKEQTEGNHVKEFLTKLHKQALPAPKRPTQLEFYHKSKQTADEHWETVWKQDTGEASSDQRLRLWKKNVGEALAKEPEEFRKQLIADIDDHHQSMVSEWQAKIESMVKNDALSYHM
jgi:hypothetical protein